MYFLALEIMLALVSHVYFFCNFWQTLTYYLLLLSPSAVLRHRYRSAPVVHRMFRCMLGGPFFTTVPSGRVGRNRDSAYYSNEAFVQGIRRAERDDQVG